MLAFVPKEHNKESFKKKLSTLIVEDNQQEENLSNINPTQDSDPISKEQEPAEEPAVEPLEEAAIINTELDYVRTEEETAASKLKFLIDDSNWNDTFKLLDLDLGTKQLASHCSFLRTDDSIIYLSMPEEKLELFSGKHRQRLQESISIFLGHECNVFFESGEVSDESPNTIKAAEKDKIRIEAEKAIKEDPNVKILLDSLDGKIIDSSIEPRDSK